MHGIPILLPLLLLLWGPRVQKPPPDDLAAKSRRGKELMAAGEYAKAIPVYRELVRALPDNPGLLLNLGMALHLAGQDREAIAPLEAALRLQPDLLPAALFLGASHVRVGQPEAAVGPLETAVRLQPDNREALSLLVDALLALDRPAQAEPHLRRLAGLAPSEPAVWFNLGKAYEHLAQRAFLALAERDAESGLALALAAEARLKEGQRNEAFHLYRRAIERSPAQRGLHAAVAGIYRSAGHTDWAAVEEQRERALPRPDCSRDTLECAFEARKHVEVVAAASSAKTPEASYWLVRAYNELAVQAFARLTALPPSPQSHEWMAQVERDARRHAESAERWRQAIALAPGDARLRVELAVTLRLARDFAAAQKVLEDVVRAEPDAPEANYLLGDVLLAQQQPERAIPFLEKAVRAEPRQPHAQGALGRAYALVGRPAEAIPHLQQSLPADVDGSLRYQLARAYQATGQAERAQAALKDYEEFRQAVQAGASTQALTPP